LARRRTYVTAAAAKWRLARVNCGAAFRRVHDPSRRSPRGVVIDQEPKFGAVLRAGGKVRLTVRFGRRG
jgi:beta-lactam-binding protein with PASTA domain